MVYLWVMSQWLRHNVSVGVTPGSFTLVEMRLMSHH